MNRAAFSLRGAKAAIAIAVMAGCVDYDRLQRGPPLSDAGPNATDTGASATDSSIVPGGCTKIALDVMGTLYEPQYAWATYRAFEGAAPDTAENKEASSLRLFENDTELGPAHALHADIRNIGKGRYSHYGDATSEALRFSTSDNTSPKENGRQYFYCVPH